MTASKRIYLALDVGERRVGLAVGDSIGKIAQPLQTIVVDGTQHLAIAQAIASTGATDVVVGLPRDQSGNTTAQTEFARQFVAEHITPLQLPIYWQDESVTSVIAEQRLIARKKTYTKADIDAEAATIILQDFLDTL